MATGDPLAETSLYFSIIEICFIMLPIFNEIVGNHGEKMTDLRGDLLVSVIIPVYNVSQYLVEALESVISQSYRRIEIIVIDDGSTDDSGAICDYYANIDDRIIIIHQKNSGLSHARNVGLVRATGELIAFLDPDDAFHPSMIQVMIEEMKRHKADIVICDYLLSYSKKTMEWNKQKDDQHVTRLVDRKEALNMILEGEIDTAPWNKIYNRRIWEKLRFPEGHVFEGTYTVFDVFIQSDRVAIIDQKLVLHRIRSGSICRTLSLQIIQDFQYAFEKYYFFVNKHTPALFSNKQLNKLMQNRIWSIKKALIIYSHRNPKDVEGKRFVRSIEKKVARGIDLQHSTFLIRMEYFFMNIIPSELWIAIYIIVSS